MIAKRIIFIAVATTLAIGGFALLQNPGQKAEGKQTQVEQEEHGEHKEANTKNIPLSRRQMAAVDIRMGEVEPRELDAVLHVNGTLVLRPQNVGNVTSLMDGVVKSVLVSEGENVNRGQIVATIENTEVVSMQREYYTASEECSAAFADMKRQRQLSEGGAGVKKNLQQAEKQYRVAQANMTGIGRQLTQMGINIVNVAKGHFTTVFPLRAPISGTISKINASIGSYANMQTPLMTIRNNNALECDLNVFEKDIDKIKSGDRVLISLTNQGNKTVTGRVYGTNEYFNDNTKAVAVHVKLDKNENVKLIAGMYVSGQIATGRQRCNTLPSRAIVNTDGKQYIFALNKGKKNKDADYEFSRHEVTTGVSQDGFTQVELCKHIGKDTKIVTDNAFYLASLTEEHGEH